MLSQFVNLNLFAFLLVFSRIGAAFSMLPGFSSRQVTMKARLIFAVAVSFLMTPLLMEFLPSEPASVSVLVLLIMSEILIGLFLGIIPRVFMAALQTTGTLVAMLASLSNMFAMDNVSEQQSSVLAGYLSIIGLTLVFVTNTHHLMLQAVVDSYALFIPAQGPMIADMTDYLAHRVSDSFRLGLQMSSPMLLAGLAYYLGIGIMGRLMPQLPIFFFGMPIQISLQIYLFAISLTTVMMVFMQYFTEGIYNLIGAEGLFISL
ncbi:MAG: flagellar biosynthetic protein FliR [Rhodospirillaceae bacterium]|nr:MAG: flagellar biosynthetic protein FliR [Rhodospirillaceae bacterium]